MKQRSTSIILFASFFLFSCVNSNKKKIRNDLAEWDLKGQVKSAIVSEYNAAGLFENAYKEGDIVTKTTSQFNEKGNILRWSEESFGNLFSENIYTYDTRGYNSERSFTSFASTGNITFKYIYEYDNKGNKIGEKTFGLKDDFIGKKIFNYDKYNNLIEKKEYYEKETPHKRETFKYDKNNLLIESSQFGKDGSLINKSQYSYDVNGNLIDHTWHDLSGEINGKITIKYDDSGNQLEWSQVDKNGTYLFKYKYKYSFDNKGNWIRKVTFNKDQPYGFEEREIEYY